MFFQLDRKTRKFEYIPETNIREYLNMPDAKTKELIYYLIEGNLLYTPVYIFGYGAKAEDILRDKMIIL